MRIFDRLLVRLWDRANSRGEAVFGDEDDGRLAHVKDVLYTIALQNADGYEALARRAEKSSDQELAGFFREMRNEARQNAEKAKTLLAERVAE